MPRRAPIVQLAAVALLTMAGVGASPVAAADPPSYTVVDLGPLAYTGEVSGMDPEYCALVYGGSVEALNADGVATGGTARTDRASAAFRATDGKVKRLKSGPGGGLGVDINGDGQVAGYVIDEIAGELCDPSVIDATVNHAATWIGGKLTKLPEGDATASAAYAINDDGLIAGVLRGETQTPALWRDGELVELPLPPGFTGGYAIDIDAAGNVLGRLSSATSNTGGALWVDGEPTVLPEDFFAHDMTPEGAIAGNMLDGGNLAGAATLVDGKPEPLPGSPEDASFVRVDDSNDAGQVIGAIDGVATMWQSGEAIEIAPLVADDGGLTLTRVTGINELGMMVGYADGEDGRHGVLLMPAGS